MADYLTPGVYREDVFPPPTPTFRTGVPAFLGRTTTGPRAPQRLALWPQFEETFGPGPAGATGFLADAVHGFFANDGLVCYVVRLDSTGPVAEQFKRALAAVDDLDDVDLICAPDLMAPLLTGPHWPCGAAVHPVTDLQAQLIGHCQSRGNRFAILDAVPARNLRVVAEQREALAASGSGGFGALYYPWLWTSRGTSRGTSGAGRAVPPCGHLAGSYARTDRHIGVHKAPANDVLDGVVDLQTHLGNGDIGTLYASGVNCLRAFPGRGIRAWGARTLDTDPLRRDVHVRRLLGTISRWIERFLTGLVHEPNSIRLWVRIMREISAYLDGLYQRGALQGRTAAEAFFVKCDNETNTKSAVDAGMVVTEIGVAPTAPAEFIMVRIIHGTSGVTVSAA